MEPPADCGTPSRGRVTIMCQSSSLTTNQVGASVQGSAPPAAHGDPGAVNHPVVMGRACLELLSYLCYQSHISIIRPVSVPPWWTPEEPRCCLKFTETHTHSHTHTLTHTHTHTHTAVLEILMFMLQGETFASLRKLLNISGTWNQFESHELRILWMFSGFLESRHFIFVRFFSLTLIINKDMEAWRDKWETLFLFWWSLIWFIFLPVLLTSELVGRNKTCFS